MLQTLSKIVHKKVAGKGEKEALGGAETPDSGGSVKDVGAKYSTEVARPAFKGSIGSRGYDLYSKDKNDFLRS